MATRAKKVTFHRFGLRWFGYSADLGKISVAEKLFFCPPPPAMKSMNIGILYKQEFRRMRWRLQRHSGETPSNTTP